MSANTLHRRHRICDVACLAAVGGDTSHLQKMLLDNATTFAPEDWDVVFAYMESEYFFKRMVEHAMRVAEFVGQGEQARASLKRTQPSYARALTSNSAHG